MYSLSTSPNFRVFSEQSSRTARNVITLSGTGACCIVPAARRGLFSHAYHASVMYFRASWLSEGTVGRTTGVFFVLGRAFLNASSESLEARNGCFISCSVVSVVVFSRAYLHLGGTRHRLCVYFKFFFDRTPPSNIGIDAVSLYCRNLTRKQELSSVVTVRWWLFSTLFVNLYQPVVVVLIL